MTQHNHALLKLAKECDASAAVNLNSGFPVAAVELHDIAHKLRALASSEPGEAVAIGFVAEDGLFGASAIVAMAKLPPGEYKLYAHPPTAATPDDATRFEGWNATLIDAEEIFGNSTDERIRSRASRIVRWLKSHRYPAQPEQVREDGCSLIAAERRRQVEAEDWTAEHDDEHGDGILAAAAACYAMPPNHSIRESTPPLSWPWDEEWWKPTPHDRVRELVKAGALIAAEIDRLKRAALEPAMQPEQVLEIDALVEFFRSPAGAAMGRDGDSRGWTPEQTAGHYGIPYAALQPAAQPDISDLVDQPGADCPTCHQLLHDTQPEQVLEVDDAAIERAFYTFAQHVQLDGFRDYDKDMAAMRAALTAALREPRA